MKVLKFGGTSVGSAQRMKDVAKLITDGEQKIVVLSAMSGTTNTLVEISDYLYKKNPEGANEIINKLENKYKQHIEELYSTEEYKQKTLEFVKSVFDYIRSYTKDIFTLFEEKVILAQGEIISTNMVTNYLCEQGVNAVLLPALEYMRTDKNSEPDTMYIREKLRVQLANNPGDKLFTMPNASFYEFGVLMSNVHMAWMRAVCGRLKSDYSYSNTIVYNNFPWPVVTEKNREQIEKSAQEILKARTLYPSSNLAALYDPLTMPAELRRAHTANDKAVMAAYGFSTKMTEADCVGELMKLYQKMQ